MSSQDSLAALEAKVLEAAAGDWIRNVDRLRVLLAAQSPELARQVLALVAPKIEAVALAGVREAFNIGVGDTMVTIANVGGLEMPETYRPENAARGTKAVVKREGFGSTGHLAGLKRVIERGGMSGIAGGILAGLDAEGAAALSTAQTIALAGGDPLAIMASLIAHRNSAAGRITESVNQAANEAITRTSDAAGVPTVWIAERNACVECLAYSGQVSEVGGSYPNGLTYGRKAYSAGYGLMHPPKHRHCRCDQEPLLSREYAAALRREADRSVLRGFSLEGEGMGTRVDAAKRLLSDGVTAPKSVKAFGASAVKRGRFNNRGGAALSDVGPDLPPNGPKRPPTTGPDKPPAPATPPPSGPTAAQRRKVSEDIAKRVRDELAAAEAKAAAAAARAEAVAAKARADAAAKLAAAAKARDQAARKLKAKNDAARADNVTRAEENDRLRRKLDAARADNPVTDKRIPLSQTIKTAKTPTEAAAMVAERFPGMDVIGFDKPKVNLKATTDALGSLSDMLDKYPAAKLTAVEAMSIRTRGVLAQVRTPIDREPNSGKLYGTPRMEVALGRLRDPKGTRDAIESSVKTGHFHKVDAEAPLVYAIQHEFGHVIDANLQTRGRGPILRDVIKDDLVDKGITNRYSAEGYAWTKANISGYGRTSTAEHVAEAFADVEHNGAAALPLSKKVHKALIEAYDVFAAEEAAKL